MRLTLKKSAAPAERARALREGLAGRRVRMTRVREVVLDQIMDAPGHFGAEDLLDALRRRGRRVSRATVYRTLDLLVGAGLLQRIAIDEEGGRYEVMQGREPHAHLYCVGCGELADYPVKELRSLQGKVQRRAGFAPRHVLVRISGLCGACRRRGRGR